LPADATKQLFLAIGRRAFLENGFASVSLRGICKEAGYTLGAFYRHFPSKEALFEALVREDADRLMEIFLASQREFAVLPPEQQIASMVSVAGGGFAETVAYALNHFDSIKLIFCRSEGTDYARYLDRMIEVEVESTHRFIDLMNRNNHPVRDIDASLVHILATSVFQGIVEIFDHDMPYENALRYAEQLREFYTAGWERLLGL
jgi:AcrR family transcriptional regulator